MSGHSLGPGPQPQKPTHAPYAPAEKRRAMSPTDTPPAPTRQADLIHSIEQQPDLSRRDRAVLLHLASQAFNGSSAIAGYREVAKSTGMDPRTVRRSLADLQRRRILYPVQRLDPYGGRLSNEYIIERGRIDGLDA